MIGYTVAFTVLFHSFTSEAFLSSQRTSLRSSSNKQSFNPLQSSIPTWQDIEKSLEPSISQECPLSTIDSALQPEKPTFSTEKPTLFRERHGWCPYSERVWLAFEVKNVHYDTIRIDNTGPGRKPSYFSGQTPQMKWEDGKIQGESMDLVKEIDKRYPGDITLYPDDIYNDIVNKIRAFSNTFPKRSRPSSRAAFLFRWDGEALWKNEFEKVLKDTDALLAETKGPFFCGERFTAADIAWAPFLERYSAQLPVLHDGLEPYSHETYPHLAAWYDAMNTKVPAYPCRVKGDSSSWRKVLSMAGYGNAGIPPSVSDRMNDMALAESVPLTSDQEEEQQGIWSQYVESRPWIAATPELETASIITKNRKAILSDTLNRGGSDLPQDMDELDEVLRGLAGTLCDLTDESSFDVDVTALASFLDQRMCVPRDMGSICSGVIKRMTRSKVIA